MSPRQNRINSLAAGVTLLAVSATSLVAPTRAHAAFGAPFTAVSAAIAVTGGGFIGVGAYFARKKKHREFGWGMILAGILFLVLLDDETRVASRFSELSPDAGDALGITDRERLAYNTQLDEINAIYLTVLADAEPIAARKNVEEREVADFMHRRWNEYRSALDPEAFSALTKVSAKIRNEVARQAR